MWRNISIISSWRVSLAASALIAHRRPRHQRGSSARQPHRWHRRRVWRVIVLAAALGIGGGVIAAVGSAHRRIEKHRSALGENKSAQRAAHRGAGVAAYQPRHRHRRSCFGSIKLAAAAQHQRRRRIVALIGGALWQRKRSSYLYSAAARIMAAASRGGIAAAAASIMSAKIIISGSAALAAARRSSRGIMQPRGVSSASASLGGGGGWRRGGSAHQRRAASWLAA